jgi:peptidoglycan/LPS O-acetylase OafA/YrhL
VIPFMEFLNDRPDLDAGLRKRTIPGLSAVRAFSVLAVIAYHCGVSHVNGAYGVVAFFVLSGFLITWLLLQERARFGSIDLAAFYERRALRIFPAFYLYWLILVLLLAWLHKPINWPHALSAALYYSNYYHAFLGDPNDGFSHTWSLAIEEQFYLLWPPLLTLLAGLRRPLHGTLAMLVLVVWVYRLLLVYGFGIDQSWLYAAFDTRFDSLLVGCLTAVLLFEQRAPVLLKFFLSSAWVAIPVIGLLLLAIGPAGGWWPRYRDTIGMALAPPLIAVLIIQAIAMSGSRWGAWLEWAPLTYLGRISYGMYLYQQLTVDFVSRHMLQISLSAKFLLALLLTIVCASVSYWALERPCLKIKARLHAPRD